MEWLELKIDTSPSGLDAVTALLEQQGITSVIIDDEADFKDFLEHNRQYWDYVDEDLLREKAGVSRVTFYLERNEDALNIVAQVRIAMSALKKEHPEYGPMLLTIDNVADADWENNWKQYFKPFRVGETFLIKPSWEQCEPEEGRRILEIDPSSSFGTGTHNTTQLCICELERLVKSGDRLLDMGCGSGILSVAAHMLGAEDVTAVDIDPNAVRIAAENAEKNGFALHTGVGDVIGDAELSARIGGDYDIIVANIVADVIMGMQDILKSKLKREGTLIVSGIIAPRADEVQASLLGAGFVLDRRDQSGDWVAMTLHQA